MNAPFLVHMNAVLNLTALVLLIVGVVFVKRGRIAAHRKVMIAAFVASSLFLVSYLANRSMHPEKPYHGDGLDRVFYYIVLATHIPLAAAVPVFAILLIRFGLKGRIDKHKRLARVAVPIWVYVSVTGVVIYLMLFWFNPPPPAS